MPSMTEEVSGRGGPELNEWGETCAPGDPEPMALTGRGARGTDGAPILAPTATSKDGWNLIRVREFKRQRYVDAECETCGAPKTVLRTTWQRTQDKIGACKACRKSVAA